MLNFKTTLVLALIFVIGVVGVVLLQKHDKKTEEVKEKQGKLLTLEKEKIKEVFLFPSNIHIVKDSNEWKIVSPIATEGDKSQVDAMVNMFDWAKTERTVSSDPDEYSLYGLRPELGRMVIVHDAGSDTLYLGDKTPTDAWVFARRSGSPDVVMTTTSLQSNIEKKLFDLRSKDVLMFDKNQLKQFSLQTAGGSYAFEKIGGSWNLTRPIAEKADDSKVNEVVNRMDNERVKEYVDENPTDVQKYGLNKPTAKVEMQLGESRAQKTLLIGKMQGNQYYAQDTSRPPVFLVDSAFVGVLNVKLFDMRNKKLADFTATDVNKVEINFSDSTIVAVKDTADEWQITAPEAHKAKNWKFSSLTSSVAGLQAKEFVAPSSSLKSFGLDKPVVKTRLSKDEALLTEIHLGSLKGDKIYAKVADKNNIYLVEKSILDKLKLRLKDIIEEPAPAKESAGKNEE